MSLSSKSQAHNIVQILSFFLIKSKRDNLEPTQRLFNLQQLYLLKSVIKK